MKRNVPLNHRKRALELGVILPNEASLMVLDYWLKQKIVGLIFNASYKTSTRTFK
ncbi:MAG: hypothetical protein LBR37_01690 [Erysipelotrichaceae bacterium]|jgi:hypothetical protein|nr:hypothetical protein [Erysipelotrichaceae bacterium]